MGCLSNFQFPVCASFWPYPETTHRIRKPFATTRVLRDCPANRAIQMRHSPSALAGINHQGRTKLKACRSGRFEAELRRSSSWQTQQERRVACRIWHRMGRWYCCSTVGGGDHFATASWRSIATVTRAFGRMVPAWQQFPSIRKDNPKLCACNSRCPFRFCATRNAVSSRNGSC